MTPTPRPSRLTAQQRLALAILNDGGPMTLHALAHELGSVTEGVSRTTASLRRRGLAEKIAGASGRTNTTRAGFWQLTDYGRLQIGRKGYTP